MQQIRDNIYRVTFAELGKPSKRGDVKVDRLGTVMVDVADLNYASNMAAMGYEPTFFVSRSEAMGGRYVVVSRQQKA